MFPARFCDASDAPLHLLSVEFELCFCDVVVVLPDDLGIVSALLLVVEHFENPRNVGYFGKNDSTFIPDL